MPLWLEMLILNTGKSIPDGFLESGPADSPTEILYFLLLTRTFDVLILSYTKLTREFGLGL